VPSARYGNWCIRNAHSIWGRTVGFDVESRTLFSSRDTTTITSSSRHFHHHHSTTSSISRTADNYPTSNSPSSRATCLRLKALDHKSYPRGLSKRMCQTSISMYPPETHLPTQLSPIRLLSGRNTWNNSVPTRSGLLGALGVIAVLEQILHVLAICHDFVDHTEARLKRCYTDCHPGQHVPPAYSSMLYDMLDN
jgi:hypothetical protein